MNKILGMARRSGFAFNFFDNVCIFAKNCHDSLIFLRLIFEQLKRDGLTLNLEKCQFGE